MLLNLADVIIFDGLSLCQVTLMLMDQGPSRKHLGDAFKPDPNSSSFRRPQAEMNIASGCPLFVSQSVLETGSYIKDDTIFIKVGACIKGHTLVTKQVLGVWGLVVGVWGAVLGCFHTCRI